MAKTTVKKRTLTEEQILDAALEILRENDRAALTMRRVAQACGVTPMALYHHINDKDTLAERATDRIFQIAVDQFQQDANPWRKRLINLVCRLRSDLIAYPGTGEIFTSQAVIGPGTAATTEAFFVCISQAGLTGEALVEAADAVTMLLIGSVANELTRPARVRERLATPETDHPTPLMAQHLSRYANRDPDARFQQALNWLLDAVEQQATA